MRKIAFLAACSALALAGAQMQMASHQAIMPDDIKWGPAPPGLPAGSEFAVLAGDPSKEGPFTIRARMHDGYKVPPHWHSTTENVTVLQGELYMGMADKIDTTQAQLMTAGAFCELPAKSHHYVQAKGDVIIQVHAMGPFDINYIDPKDDPRKG